MAKKKQSKSEKKIVPKVRIAQPSGRPFQIRYTCPNEKREIRISVGSRDIEDAEQMKAEIEARFLLGLAPQEKKGKVFGPEMAWDDFREEYRVLHLSALRDRTAEDVESRLDIAERIVKPKTLGDMAKSATLQKLKSRLLAGEQGVRGKPRSPHTVRGYLRSILAALNWAYDQDWLETPPKLPRIKTSKNPMKGRPISAAEFKQMLESVSEIVGKEAAPSWKYVLQGLWESALRIDELMHLSWDLPGTIRPVWQPGKHPVLEIPAAMQKNDTFQTIPLLPGFEKLILETPETDRKGWIFNPLSLQLKLGRKVRHERPDSDWVGKVISRIGKEAKIIVEQGDEKTGRPIKFASAHDLRRSCGERLRNAGVPPLVIIRIMRHSSWETTQKHYAPGDVQQAAESLHQILVQEESKEQQSDTETSS